jgi:hypothetical protein
MLQAAAIFAFVGSVAAQSSVVTLLLPQFDPQPMYASVIAAVPAATTYTLACPAGVASESCGVGPIGPTVVNGPSTFEIHYTQTSADAS